MKPSILLSALLVITAPIVSAFPAGSVNKTKANETNENSEQTEANDFINFTNDDTLHGKFLGFTTSGKIIWKNPSAEENIAFTPEQVRKVVLNKGRLVKPFTHTSFLTLTNQDTIPGAIVELNGKTITLRTDYAGDLEIPREVIRSIDFQPLGDKIHYRGPFTEDDWETFPYNYTTTKPKSESKEKPAWELINFALKNTGLSGVIMHKEDFTNKARYTFKLTHRNSVMPSFVLSADMKQPEVKKERDANDDEKANIKIVSNRASKITEVVGTSLIFRLTSYSSSLNFYGFDDEGVSFTQSIPNSLQNVRANRTRQDNVVFDIRMDKESDTVILYADQLMVGQWDISSFTKKLTGNKIGFVNLYSSGSNASMISDIVVSSWNGVVDPAKSMENSDRDTILLSNGTDRYSGKALNLVQNKLQLKGPYADLEIPTDQIQSLYFAEKDRRDLPAKAESEVSLRFHGSGRLTGSLAKGPHGKIILDSGVLGKLTILSEFISSYEFEDMDYSYEITK